MMAKGSVVLVVLAATLVRGGALTDHPPSSADIVAAADNARNPSQPFRVSLALIVATSVKGPSLCDFQ